MASFIEDLAAIVPPEWFHCSYDNSIFYYCPLAQAALFNLQVLKTTPLIVHSGCQGCPVFPTVLQLYEGVCNIIDVDKTSHLSV